MSKRLTLRLVFLSLAFVAASGAALASSYPPPPAGGSVELQKLLSGAKPGDPKAALEGVPATIEDWKRVIANSDRDGSIGMLDYAKSVSVNVEETSIAGVRVYRVTPVKVAPEHANHIFVFIHGGAFTFGHGLAGTYEAIGIAAKLGMPVLSIDYRMAPEHPAPAAMDDIVAVWGALLAERPARTMALGGTSAGGNLTLVGTLRLKDLGLELPGALFVGTPAADLAKRGDSRFINEGVDQHLITWDAEAAKAIAFYVKDKSYDDPYISPVFGNFNGFPPTYLISGTRDLLLSDTVRAHRRLRQANVDADLHVYEGHSHGDYSNLLDTPESAEHFRELGTFLLRHLEK